MFVLFLLFTFTLSEIQNNNILLPYFSCWFNNYHEGINGSSGSLEYGIIFGYENKDPNENPIIIPINTNNTINNFIVPLEYNSQQPFLFNYGDNFFNFVIYIYLNEFNENITINDQLYLANNIYWIVNNTIVNIDLTNLDEFNSCYIKYPNQCPFWIDNFCEDNSYCNGRELCLPFNSDPDIGICSIPSDNNLIPCENNNTDVITAICDDILLSCSYIPVTPSPTEMIIPDYDIFNPLNHTIQYSIETILPYNRLKITTLILQIFPPIIISSSTVIITLPVPIPVNINTQIDCFIDSDCMIQYMDIRNITEIPYCEGNYSFECIYDTCLFSNSSDLTINCHTNNDDIVVHPLFCSNEKKKCLMCIKDSDCDDGLWCNGQETCDNIESNSCLKGTIPCNVTQQPYGLESTSSSIIICSNELKQCVETFLCFQNSDCDDGLLCTPDTQCDLSSHTCVISSSGSIEEICGNNAMQCNEDIGCYFPSDETPAPTTHIPSTVSISDASFIALVTVPSVLGGISIIILIVITIVAIVYKINVPGPIPPYPESDKMGNRLTTNRNGYKKK